MLTQQLAASSDLTQQLQVIIRDSGNSTAAKDMQIAQLAEQLSIARQDWSALQAAKGAELDALQSQLLQHSASVERLQYAVQDTSNSTAAKDAQIAELNASVQQLQYALQDASNSSAAKDVQVADLTQQLQIVARDSSNSTAAKEAQIAELMQQLSAARQAWAALSDAKDAKEAELTAQVTASQGVAQQMQVPKSTTTRSTSTSHTNLHLLPPNTSNQAVIACSVSLHLHHRKIVLCIGTHVWLSSSGK